MKDEILKILESYIKDGYRTERGIYDNDIDDVADELVKLFAIHNVSVSFLYEFVNEFTDTEIPKEAIKEALAKLNER
jgi:hypothetical protein